MTLASGNPTYFVIDTGESEAGPDLWTTVDVYSAQRCLFYNVCYHRHCCCSVFSTSLRQKATEALVTFRSDGLVIVVIQECLKMSFKTVSNRTT